MTSLIVIGLITAYVAMFVFIVRKARNRPQKVAATAIAIVIPFWDLPVGYFNFLQSCLEEGGVRVTKIIPPAPALLIDETTRYTPHEVLRFGFTAVEFSSPDGTVRFTKGSNGVTKSVHAAPMSELKIEHTGVTSLSWNLDRWDYVARSIKDGSVVATQRDFRWRGMWWQIAMAPFLGEGPYCMDDSAPTLLAVLANPNRHAQRLSHKPR